MRDIIGFMDSGVGGISVLKRAVELLPNENYVFFGDNANAPYGPRPLEEIVRLSEAAVQRLLNYDVKAIVIACNTATSAYAEIIRAKVDIPIIGMEPAIKPASMARTDGIILALATQATLSLSKFEKLMDRYGEGVVPVIGKGLVEIVESGKAGTAEADKTLKELLGEYTEKNVEGIVLGCTHYPFLKDGIQKLFPNTPVYDGRTGTVRQLARRLEETGRLTKNSEPGNVRFETSGGEDKLQLMKTLFESSNC